jgi:carbamoyl-phosphate synthase small subunit
MRKAWLVLEDGGVFQGRSVGVEGTRLSEIVFHTGMTGYQEVLTDPSYCGQTVVMTYPHIGSYGITKQDMESRKVFLAGFVMGNCVQEPSNYEAIMSLPHFFKEQAVVAIDSVDTRALTRRIREKGAMKAMLTTDEAKLSDAQSQLKNMPSMEGSNLVDQVVAAQPQNWTENTSFEQTAFEQPHVLVLDCGAKYNIHRNLVDQGARVTVVPYHTALDEIKSLSPDAIMVSNGPGDPAMVPQIQKTLRALIGHLPIMGICLGHQLLALALGAKTYKMKFGHHGSNHPVLNLKTGKIEITSQNHGFAVDQASLQAVDDQWGPVELTHVHLSDQTVEGFSVPEAKVTSIQYHPEAAPGPHDSHYLFKEFVACIKTSTKKS